MSLFPIDESVRNSVDVSCFLICDPSSPENNVLDDENDQITGDENTCCSSGITTSGYGADTTACTPCKFFWIILHVCK